MPRLTTAQKRDAFFALHESGCFVLPNPWDAGSARLLEHLGFAAIATTSTGFAWTMARPDYKVTLDDLLGHLKALSEAVDIPVNADFEWGFASSLGELKANIARAIETGIAALSIEDRNAERPGELYPVEAAVERLRAARQAIDESGQRLMLVGRTEELLLRPASVEEAIGRLVKYAEAGADCLYAPGVSEPGDIEAMVKAVAPKPLNVLALGDDVDVAMYKELGVRRISVGGSLALVGWGAVIAAAEKLKNNDFSGLAGTVSGGNLNAVFGSMPR
jgi:2-methylisocitrate lyase-like PEP mutase family enzyme